MITACLNGSRTRQEHPAIPVDVDSIAKAARGAVAAGATALHVHPRGEQGRESLSAVDVAVTRMAIRDAAPGVPLGVTTGLWVTGSEDTQVAAVRGWDRHSLPDLASVNFAEPDAEGVCAALAELDVGIEAGLWTVADAERFMAWPGRAAVARILVEPMEQDLTEAIATAERILAVVDAVDSPRQVHGTDRTAWPVLKWATDHGYEIRAGFEDMLHLPSGDPAPDNAALVTAAARLRPVV